MTNYLNERALYPPLIHKRPSPLLGITVVIPCYDEDFLLLSLMSLQKCERPACDVEIIVVINQSESTPGHIAEKNRKTFEQASHWAGNNRSSHLRFHILLLDELPVRHAGVGLARKIGMDEACYRFHKAGNPHGIIACFDADSRCDRNYLRELESHFTGNPKLQACSIYFEHPLSGPDYGDEIYQAITGYELHLRYYVNAQRRAGFPYAWQTIGSSMAVRCDAYQKQGGMNRRKAGEDFYFLHKFIPLGHFDEITSTRVIPSPRISGRVPFGTGKAVGELVRTGSPCQTYNPRSFDDLAVLLKREWPLLYDATDPKAILTRLPDSIRTFLEQNNFLEKIKEVRKHTANRKSFENRLWLWFDAFLLMKYVHYARDHYYPDTGVESAAARLLAGLTGREIADDLPARDLLLAFRQLDRNRNTRDMAPGDKLNLHLSTR